jgi:uncharacterized protein YndB with AHSA1/START domain
MAVYRFEILVDAPPERVFSLWTDLDRLHEWTVGVTRVTEVTGPTDQPGTRYTVWFGRMPSKTEVLQVARPWHVRTRFGNFVLRGESEVTFAPEGGKTRLTQTLRPRGWLSALSARVFATGSYKGSFRAELEAFRELAELEERANGS